MFINDFAERRHCDNYGVTTAYNYRLIIGSLDWNKATLSDPLPPAGRGPGAALRARAVRRARARAARPARAAPRAAQREGDRAYCLMSLETFIDCQIKNSVFFIPLTLFSVFYKVLCLAKTQNNHYYIHSE